MLETECLTPGTNYTTHINNKKITITINLPFQLPLKEVVITERLLHNMIELVLARFFTKKD